MAGLFLGVLVSISYGIGSQHGLFRSQSTQGTAWQGSATITREHYAITVFPDYLDVELEWEFTVGGAEPDSFKNALEIVGNLNLEKNSTVVGMLVWYNGKILKGKLKTNGVARNEYEQVVERNADAPPPPRDPVLLEMVRDDNYDISIFPISFGGTRKLRIRYLIPGATVNGQLKMGYPHAFSKSATVAIRKGTGVDSYLIETAKTPIIYTNATFADLSSNTYAFQACANSGDQQRISAIIPVLSGKPRGTNLYVGNFTTDSFSGSMAHLSCSGAQIAQLTSAIKEDFVVIWRWNHPVAQRLYVRQVAAQAEQLIAFFTALNATTKRGALIISKQGGETVKFSLDRSGGATFSEMLSFLTSLSKTPNPIASSGVTVKVSAIEAERIAHDSFEEFKKALQEAVAMLQETTARKQILVLTVGPNTATEFDSGLPQLADTGMSLRSFTTYGGSNDQSTLTSYQCWPGVALSRLIAPPDTALKVFAYLSNGTEIDSFQANLPLYSYGRSMASDRFVYSDKPLIEQVVWKVYQGSTLLSEVTEQPYVVPIADTMQYARLVGSLASMYPLATSMPTSVAATLGFIDMKYTLLALEGDTLDFAVAAQYELSGVPGLDQGDLFPADSDKVAIPVAAWLLANRRDVSGSNNWMKTFRDVIVVDMVENTVAPPVGGAAVMWTNPAAATIYFQSDVIEVNTYDVASVLPTVAASNSSIHAPVLQVKPGALTVDFGVTPALSATAELVLYDLFGRVVMRYKLAMLLAAGSSQLQITLPNLKKGMYLVRLEKSPVQFAQTIIIR